MIYKTLLGEDFTKLHPKLQHRYLLPFNTPFSASGLMQKITSGPKWVKPMYWFFTRNQFLFPESGRNIPFTITNTSFINDTNEGEVYWERTFHFQNASRKFNARMTVDLQNKVVKDYLGEPPLFYSDLIFNVTNEGFLLIRSQEQRVVIGGAEFGLPKKLQGRVTVLEGYDDEQDAYTIHVVIYNDVLGRMMHYAGKFKETVC